MSKIFKNIGSNWICMLATIFVTYIITPFLIHALGIEGYGIWNLIMSFTGYLNLLILGVPMASVRYLTEYGAKRDLQKINEVIGSCLGLYTITGIISLIIGSVLFVFFISNYDIPPIWQIDSRIAFIIVILYTSIGFVAILPEGIIMSHHDFIIRNFIVLSVLLFRLLLIFLFFSFFSSITLLAFIQTCCIIIDFLISFFLIKWRYKGLKFSFRNFNWITVRRIFSFSLFVLILNLGARFSFETDAIVIGAFLDIGQISYYTIANNFLIYLIQFIVSIAAVLMPTAVKLNTENKISELREIFLKWSKISFSLSLLFGIFLIFFGPKFISWWISPDFEKPAGEVLQVLILSCFIYLPARGIAQPILMGLGKVKTPTISFLIAGIINLVMSIALIKSIGLIGVAIGTAFPTALFGLVLLILTCRELDISVVTFMRYTFLRPLIGGLILVAILFIFQDVFKIVGIVGVILGGFLTTIVFILIWLILVYKNDPYFTISTNINQALKRFKK